MNLFHISDLHFGMYQENIVTAFFDDLLRIQPDIVIISGDLTQRATKEQYKLFQTFVQKIPCVVLVVPGNHDIPLYNVFSRLLTPFSQYKTYVSKNLTAEFANAQLRILGVNSVNPFRVKDGKLSTATLELIKNYFQSEFSGINLLFFHHNFDYIEGLHEPLENDQVFLKYLKDSKIDIVCTGHSHFANISTLERNDESACVVLHAGSTFCPRKKDGLNSYYHMVNQDKKCQITWRVFKASGNFESEPVFDVDLSQKFKIITATN